MKRHLLLIGILINTNLFAANYYFSSSLGLDGNAGTIGSPYQTIAKLNSIFSTLLPGDSVLLKCGDVWNESFSATRGGSVSGQIVISSYGTGAKPVISGLTTATGWTNMGGNIWESASIGGTNKPNLVLFNNVMKAMGRWPNTNYNFYSAFTNAYIKDPALSGKNFTGGRLCVRKLHDIISNDSITAHSVDTLYANSISGYNTLTGYGYFVENHLSTLDTEGEWYFNPATRKLSVYSATTPIGIAISTIDTLMNLKQFDFINVNNISFEGANVAALTFGGPTVGQSTNINVTKCNFNYSGRNAIYCSYTNFVLIDSCSFNNSLNNAIYGENEGGRSLNVTVTNCNIKNSGILEGMGWIQASTSSNISYNAITILGDKATVNNNVIDSTGHCGIALYYDSAVVRYNLIRDFTMVSGDAGAINFFDMSFGAYFETGREVVGNIILNGYEPAEGTSDKQSNSVGIYADDNSNSIRIDSNSVANVSKHGIYLHNTTHNQIRRNTIFNAGYAGFAIAHDDHATGRPMTNITFVNNTIAQLAPTYGIDPRPGYFQYHYNFVDGGNLDSMFTRNDSNNYARQSHLVDTTFRTIRYVGTSYLHQYLKFDTWKTAYASTPYGAWDLNSTAYVISNMNTANFQYNATASTGSYNFAGFSKKNTTGSVFNNSVNIPGWGGILLFDNGGTSNSRTYFIKRRQ